MLEASEVEQGLARSANCFLAAEIVSPSDRRPVADGKRSKLDTKIEGYRNLPLCEAILVIEQDKPSVVVYSRQRERWSGAEMSHAGDLLDLAAFDLLCPGSAIHARTTVLRA